MGVNQFGDQDCVNNTVSFRVEQRIAIGVRRPSGVCTVTGLPTSCRLRVDCRVLAGPAAVR